MISIRRRRKKESLSLSHAGVAPFPYKRPLVAAWGDGNSNPATGVTTDSGTKIISRDDIQSEAEFAKPAMQMTTDLGSSGVAGKESRPLSSLRVGPRSSIG